LARWYIGVEGAPRRRGVPGREMFCLLYVDMKEVLAQELIGRGGNRSPKLRSERPCKIQHFVLEA
jgi:hypothetical protein